MKSRDGATVRSAEGANSLVDRVVDAIPSDLGEDDVRGVRRTATGTMTLLVNRRRLRLGAQSRKQEPRSHQARPVDDLGV